MSPMKKPIFFIIGIVLVIGVIPSGAKAIVTKDKALSSQNTFNAPNYPKNQTGQTYGSTADDASLASEPDLIKAVGVDGTVGYVLKTDLDRKMPKSPKEALEQQRNAPENRVIPLYDVEGKTIIGQFIIN